MGNPQKIMSKKLYAVETLLMLFFNALTAIVLYGSKKVITLSGRYFYPNVIIASRFGGK